MFRAAVTARTLPHTHRACSKRLLLMALFVLPALAQTPSPPPNSPAPKLPRVTTTIEVHDEIKNDYSPLSVSFGGLDGVFQFPQEIPLSLNVTTRGLMQDQSARVLSDVVKNDASIGEDYAPVGYYGGFAIRGFPVDTATGIQIDGLTVAGEQDVPLENKDRVELVHGVAGLDSGIASAGGVINFVTRHSLAAHGVDIATDHRGGTFGSLDFGRPFKRNTDSGISFTLAGEDMRPYVAHADGWRGMGAARADRSLNPLTQLTANFEFQHKVERSEAGYQLLGGSTVPSGILPSTMLGFQPWSKPNTFDTFNAGSHLNRMFNSHWTAVIAGSYSHSLIDDNVLWPYGASLDADGNSLCPDSPYYFFCPDGSYELYDYRSPGELRINALGEALLQGHFKTRAASHNLVVGATLFHRSVDLSPATVYAALGVQNIYQSIVPMAPESPYQQASPSQLADFNHQASALTQDRVHFPGGIALQAGGRFVRVTDFNYSRPRSLWLPQYAATWTPQKIGSNVHQVTLYANYGVLLSLGPQAAWWVDNASLFLNPFFTRQAEAGIKYESRILLTADVFRMKQPFFYPRVLQAPDSFCASALPGDLCFESSGRETHTGLELSAQGKAAPWMQLNASATALRALSTQTGTPAYDSKQVINVPRFRAALFADIRVPHARGLHLMPGFSYTGRKQATRDDVVSVPSYSLINLGARYTPGGADGRVTLRLFADNITDKRYWKDTGASYGDTFLHLGAPTTVRFSAHYSF